MPNVVLMTNSILVVELKENLFFFVVQVTHKNYIHVLSYFLPMWIQISYNCLIDQITDPVKPVSLYAISLSQRLIICKYCSLIFVLIIKLDKSFSFLMMSYYHAWNSLSVVWLRSADVLRCNEKIILISVYTFLPMVQET